MKIIKKFLFFLITAFIVFSINVSFANSQEADSMDETICLPPCDGLLPDNYEYLLFLKAVAYSLIADNTPQSDSLAQRVFFLLGLRHSSLLQKEDQISITTSKDMDKIIADKLCKLAQGKKQEDLWSSSPLVKLWVKDNIEKWIQNSENILQLSVHLRQGVEISEQERKRRLRKLNKLEQQGLFKAEKKIKAME